METLFHFSLLSIGVLLSINLAKGIDPTQGFIDLPFNESFYSIQKPYDLPVDQRYSFTNGVHKFWVYSTDHSFSQNSPTKPRTELRIRVLSFSFFFILSVYIILAYRSKV